MKQKNKNPAGLPMLIATSAWQLLRIVVIYLRMHGNSFVFKTRRTQSLLSHGGFVL